MSGVSAARAAVLLTGSYAYGTPTDRSDVDLVVLAPDGLAALLQTAAGYVSEVDRDPSADDAATSVYFGKLNLIFARDAADFRAWVEATEELRLRAPVARAEAVEVVKRHLNAAKLLRAAAK